MNDLIENIEIDKVECMINELLDTGVKTLSESRYMISKILYSAKNKLGSNFNSWISRRKFNYGFGKRQIDKYIQWFEKVQLNPKLKDKGINAVICLPKESSTRRSQNDTTTKEQKQGETVTPDSVSVIPADKDVNSEVADKKITMKDYYAVETKSKFNFDRAERLSKTLIEKESLIRELRSKNEIDVVPETDYLNLQSDYDVLKKFLNNLFTYLDTTELCKLDIVKVKSSIKGVLSD